MRETNKSMAAAIVTGNLRRDNAIFWSQALWNKGQA